MTKIFFDSDVLLDALLERKPFAADMAILFALMEEKKTVGYTSSLIIANLYYLMKKIKPHQEVLIILRKLRILLKALPVGESEVDRALISDFSDFEDAIQYFTALEHKMDFLVTRNKKDYRKAKIPILSPREFLSSIEHGLTDFI